MARTRRSENPINCNCPQPIAWFKQQFETLNPKTKPWWGLCCRNEDSSDSQWNYTSLLQEHGILAHHGSGHPQPCLHRQEQDTPYSCTWPFSKQLSVEPKRNNRYITDAIFKVLSESHVIRTTICNRRNVKMPNWKLANLCGTAGDNAHTISTCSICCQTLYLIVAECVPLAIEDNSRDIGSMPFW